MYRVIEVLYSIFCVEVLYSYIVEVHKYNLQIKEK